MYSTESDKIINYKVLHATSVDKRDTLSIAQSRNSNNYWIIPALLLDILTRPAVSIAVNKIDI